MNNKRILVIGSSNTDMTAKTQELPRPGETVLGGVFTMGAGGKGANQAVAAQRLGGNVQFICKVGQDMFGDNAIEHYKKEGLDTSGILRSLLPSGVALIYVDSHAENCIVVASGANGDFTEADIEAS
jgi:ribokinase